MTAVDFSRVLGHPPPTPPGPHDLVLDEFAEAAESGSLLPWAMRHLGPGREDPLPAAWAACASLGPMSRALFAAHSFPGSDAQLLILGVPPFLALPCEPARHAELWLPLRAPSVREALAAMSHAELVRWVRPTLSAAWVFELRKAGAR